MDREFLKSLKEQLEALKEQGLYKIEQEIVSPQSPHIHLASGKKVLNFCANNYLGLASHPRIIEAARQSYERVGYGMASVRFICGTQAGHHKLEKKIASFLGVEAALLYPSCFDANGGLFETILGAEDAVISDALNHASIIDGIRLSKAKRFVYQNNDMRDLERCLQEAAHARFRLIATDGIFSMDGIQANLPAICDLSDRYNAIVMIDDCHAVGFRGKTGRGTIEELNVMGRVDIITGTLGKALGGASGGYVAGRKEVIDLLRQRSRPYLFSNALPPPIVEASLAAFDLVEESSSLREKLQMNTHYFREKMTHLGFKLIPGDHPIVPVMLGEATLAQTFAAKMLALGIYVVGFCFPVVPKGQARIRVQLSAAHSKEDIDQALAAFATVGKELNII